MDIQDILKTWGKIQVKKIISKTDMSIVSWLETLIKAIRAGKLGIKENKPKESYGVKLVLELLKTGEYNIIAEHLNQQEKNTTQNIT